jgi:hypothetical protein
MFEHLFQAAKTQPDESGWVYEAPAPSQMEAKDIERTCARLFSSDDGRKVLAYLQMITFQRALGASSPDEQLRYVEGQRALVASILRLIDRGRKG